MYIESSRILLFYVLRIRFKAACVVTAMYQIESGMYIHVCTCTYMYMYELVSANFL